MRFYSAARFGIALAALPCGAGCSTALHAQRPDENGTTSASARPAAYYEIPARRPHGDVRVATLGVATLEPRGDDTDRVQAMHVRLIADNNDDAAAWQIDTREQTTALDGYGQSRPAFASASVGRPPLVTVVPGDSTTIDLYYPLPSPLQRAAGIPHVDVVWRVQTPEGLATRRTTFDALHVEPPPFDQVGSWGWWGLGWYDPFWPDYAFAQAPTLSSAYHERPFVRVGPPAPSTLR
jgi:hypothetical protein